MPDPSRCLGFYEPNWLENFEDIRRFNFVDRLGSKCGNDILGKRVDPLRAVLGIFPSRQVLGMNGSRRLLKGWNEPALLVALGQRIAAGPRDLAKGERHLAALLTASRRTGWPITGGDADAPCDDFDVADGPTVADILMVALTDAAEPNNRATT